MKISTEIDNNFGYEKIAQLVDNIALTSGDISTITIENMPGGTPWGQAQLRIFDRKFLQALKITKLVFFFLQVMKLFTEILIRVKLIVT
jgi:hypothetical protein